MKRLIWSIVLVSSITTGYAQKNEVSEAKKKWGVYQIVMNQSLDKQLTLLNEGIKHTDLAIVHDKTKDLAEPWSLRALFSSSIAVVDTNDLDNAKKYKVIADEAIAKATALSPTKNDLENIETSKLNLETYFRNTGFLAYGKKDYKTAYETFLKIVTDNPQDTLMYGNVALTAAQNENYPVAIEYYKKAIALDVPQAKEYYQEIFNINMQFMKDTVAGLELLREATAKYPDEIYFIANETDIHMNNKDFDKAYLLLDKLIEKDPTNIMFVRIKADTYFNQAFDAQEEVRRLEDAKKFKEADEMIKKKEEYLNKALPLYLKVEADNAEDQEVIKLIRNVYFALGNNAKVEEYSKKIKTP